MISVAAVNFYICANVLLALAALLVASARMISGRLSRGFTYRHQLQLAHALTMAAVLAPGIALTSAESEILPTTAQVWSAPAMRDVAADAQYAPRVTFALARTATSAPLDLAGMIATSLILAGGIFLLVRMALEAMAIARILSGAHLLRRAGRAEIRTTDAVAVPFSFWIPGRYYIVVPASLLVRPENLRLAIRHEAEHHRRGDTKWLHAYQLLRIMFFWNPAMHVLNRSVAQLQEFACDEALKQRRPESMHAYCRCLLWVARQVMQRRSLLSASMMGPGAPALLKRRIEAVLTQPRFHFKGVAVLACASAALAIMGFTASVFAATVRDHRVSLEQANAMAATARAGSAFPIVVNDLVLSELNRLLGTPDGRAWLRASLQRMQQHEEFISGQIAKYGLPSELLAVPLIESGYRNLPQTGDARHGAGIWMFIKPTARSHGLRVDGNIDERLDVAAETDAAMRMLSALHANYGDWGLALLAYNAGSRKVDEGIRKTGSRDVWEILRSGYENDAGYIPRLMAAVLVVKNPSVLD